MRNMIHVSVTSARSPRVLARDHTWRTVKKVNERLVQVPGDRSKRGGWPGDRGVEQGHLSPTCSMLQGFGFVIWKSLSTATVKPDL